MPALSQKFRSDVIRFDLRRMLFAIEFDHYFSLDTTEVNDVYADRELAPEL